MGLEYYKGDWELMTDIVRLELQQNKKQCLEKEKDDDNVVEIHSFRAWKTNEKKRKLDSNRYSHLGNNNRNPINYSNSFAELDKSEQKIEKHTHRTSQTKQRLDSCCDGIHSTACLDWLMEADNNEQTERI
jgi:hypothetical protein